MADMANNAPFSVIATTASRVKDLVIKNGQIIFIQDKGRIAFDFKDKRVFYNQITELETEHERLNLSSPPNGYYFIIETACLWLYRDSEWVQINSTADVENAIKEGEQKFGVTLTKEQKEKLKDF